MHLWRYFRKPAARSTRHPSRGRCRPAVEGLERREVPTVTVPTPGVPGTAKITGTSGPDQFVLRLQPGAPTNIQLSDNGGASFTTAALRDVNNITVSGLAGSDTLTLDHANGFVGKIGVLPIVLDGGPGRDTLVQQGNPNLTGLNVNYLVGGLSDAGRIDATNGTISNSITFTQLNAIIDVTNAVGLTLNLNDAGNVVKVERDRSFNGLNLLKLEGVDRQSRTDAVDLVPEDRPTGDPRVPTEQSFVPVSLANKTNVTVNTFGGDDLFTLDHSRPVSGLVNLTLDGGTGTDRLYSDNGPRGVTLNRLSIDKDVPEGLDETFIEELYVTRVKRFATESEVENWKNVIRGGAGRSGIVAAIERAVESRTRLVRAWYEQYLARSASGGEESGWVNALTQGMTEELIIAGILAAPEFFARAQTLVTVGTPNERWLRAMYSVLLGRAQDGGEVGAWLGVITTTNRGGIANTFLNTAEFRGRIIDAYYTTFLQRDADAAGRQNWVVAPLNLTQIREGFASSLEFYDLNHATAVAVQLNAAGQASFSGTSVNSEDKQFFLLTAPRDGTLNVSVATTNGRFPKLQVEDVLGNKLFETEPRDNVNSGNVPVRGGQQYFFRLRAQDASPAAFTVSLRLT